jgi:hypothetical protein
LIETQNETHYLRWSSNPVDIKILKKSGKMQSKKKCRLMRYVCLKCIQEKKLNDFVKKRKYSILNTEYSQNDHPNLHTDYLFKKNFPIQPKTLKNEINDQFFHKLNFNNCVKEELLKNVIKKKIINGEKNIQNQLIFRKDNLKKVKTSSKAIITDNNKILSKILDDFKLSEKDNPVRSKFPKALPDSIQQTQKFPIEFGDEVQKNLPFNQLNNNSSNQSKNSNPNIHMFNSDCSNMPTPAFVSEPTYNSKLKLFLNDSMNNKHLFVKKKLENQLKKWKKLFSKKNEIEYKLACHKETLNITASKSLNHQINGSKDRLKKGSHGKVGQNLKKIRQSRSKIDKNGGKSNEEKIIDPKREQYEKQLIEEKFINNLIYNGNSAKLDLRMIKDRHYKILSNDSDKTENKIAKPPLLKENGHFNWDSLEYEYYNQKFMNKDEFKKLDKSLLKKVYCEFLLINDNQKKEKSIKNFLAEYLTKKHIPASKIYNYKT